jgi:hypothetical protein
MVEVEQIEDPEKFTIELVYDIFREVGDKFPPEHGTINIVHMVDEWKKFITSGLARTWLARKDGKPVGVLGALYLVDFYTGRSMVFEHFWFVLETERRSGAGLKLFRAFKKTWTPGQTVWMGKNRINSPKGLDKLYEREGFIDWATTFRKVIDHG